MEKLPKRNQAKITLRSNIVDLAKDRNVKFHQYTLDLPSTLPPEKRSSFLRILQKKVLEMTKVGAITYNQHLYSTLDTLGNKPLYILFEEKEYIIKLIYSNSFDIAITCPERQKTDKLSGYLMKLLLSRALRKNGYKEIGRTSVYINMKEKRELKEFSMFEFGGVEVKINLRSQLMVVPVSKIVKAEMVLNEIQRIYMSNQELSKEDTRVKVNEQMEGRTVMTNYKNHAGVFYKIVRVDFSNNVLTPNLVDNTNLKQYYQSKYGIQIKDLKQPLLVARSKKKGETGDILLVPELCLSVGMGDKMPQAQRRKILSITTKSPGEVHESNLKTMEMLQKQGLGRMVDLEYQEVKGTVLKLPLVYSCEEVIRVDDTGSIKIFNRKLAAHPQNNRNLRVKILYSQSYRDHLKEAETSIGSICKGFSYTLKAESEEIFFKSDYLEKIKDDKVSYVVILPKNMEDQYSKIKKHSVQHSIISQVMLESQKKSFKNIFPYFAKITIQLLSKNGVVMWSPANNIKTKETVMMVGIIVKRSQGKRLIAVVSSLDQEMNRYSSALKTSVFKNEDQEVLNYVIEAVTEYKKKNKANPQTIIVLKEEERERPDYHQKINWEKIEAAFGCSVTFVAVNDHTLLRYFQEDNSNAQNPEIGTLVEDETSDEFCLVTEKHPTMTKPVAYHIVKRGFYSKDDLSKILYSQCFNYYNWNGPVKIPSCLQYCRKLLRFCLGIGVSQYKSSETLPYL